MTMSLRRIARNWRPDSGLRAVFASALATLCHPRPDRLPVRRGEDVGVYLGLRLEEHDAAAREYERVAAQLQPLVEVVADHHEGVLAADLGDERVQDVHRVR